jgi:shikimate dehydrogenase
MGVPYAEVIGDPIAHSKSPLIHNYWLEKLSLEGEYRAVRVTSDELPAYLGSRRSDPDWRGCNVTIPHKEAVVSMLDEVEDAGIGAVNCIVPRDGRLVGRNTDSGGLDQAWDFTVDTDAPVCVIGAGGAAKAAFESLDMLAVYQFNVVARDPVRIRPLLAIHGEYARHFGFDQAEQALSGCVGAINATPLGMVGFPPMPDSVLNGLAGIRRGGFAVDMVYCPLETVFLSKARGEGLKVVDGLTILVGQAHYAFFHFFGASPGWEADAQLRSLLLR